MCHSIHQIESGRQVIDLPPAFNLSFPRGGGKVGEAGFEPTTPTTPKWCATKLRYSPKAHHYTGGAGDAQERPLPEAVRSWKAPRRSEIILLSPGFACMISRQSNVILGACLLVKSSTRSVDPPTARHPCRGESRPS